MILRRLRSIFAYLVGICRSTLEIATLSLRPPDRVADHVIRLPAPVNAPLRLYLIANLISYVPGSLVVGLEGDHYVVHLLMDAGADPAEAAADLRRFVEVWS